MINEALAELENELQLNDLSTLEIIKQEFNESEPIDLDSNVVEINIKPKKGRPRKEKALFKQKDDYLKTINFNDLKDWPQIDKLDLLSGYRHSDSEI